MRKTIHVGQMKTGTTYIQNILAKNRRKLLRNGICYPGEPVNQQHACYGLFPDYIAWQVDGEKHAKLGQKLLREISTTRNRVLISAEALSSMSREGVARLIDLFGDVENVIFTVRPLNKSLPSAWQQFVKGGRLDDIETFFDQLSQTRAKNAGLWQTYSFGHNIKVWSEFAKVNTIVVGNSLSTELWNNFSKAAELPDGIDPSIKKDDSNISLNFEAAEFLRYLNQHFKQHGYTNKERQTVSYKYLKKFILPISSKQRGMKIRVPHSYQDIVNEWNEEETSLLKAYSNEIYGGLSSLTALEESEFKSPNKQHVIEEIAFQAANYFLQQRD